jgi:hypothetical protein
MQLFKVGRRTGFTEGRLNGPKAADVHSWFTDADGQVEHVKGTVFDVIAEGCPTFGDPGDSGSFVVDGSGRLVGLYLGGDSHRGTGLFIGVEALFEDIKLVTGAERVSLPPSLPLGPTAP